MKTATKLALLGGPLVAVAGLPAAQASTPATTVSVLLPFNGADGTYLASVVTAAPSYDVYAVTCAPLAASMTASDFDDVCGPEFTITQGPSIWGLQYTVAGEASLSASCEGDVMTGPLRCIESEGGPSITDVSMSVVTEVLLSTDLASAYGVVTVTAGAELLTGGQATAKATASANASASSAASASSEASSKASVKSTASLSTVTGTSTKGTASTGSTATGTATDTAAKATNTGAAGAIVVQQGAVIGAAVLALLAL